MTDFLEPDARVLQARAKWRFRGTVRPDFALTPAQGQESVWDYPRPPLIEPDPRPIEVRFEDDAIASTASAVRVLETASPPTYYIPASDVRTDMLIASGSQSNCEWKGIAVDFDLVDRAHSVAWSYQKIFPEFERIEGWFAFYPGRITCLIDGERVRPQPGDYYGGWITEGIVGPFKGEY